MFCTITNASFCNEVKFTKDGQQEHRSQQGFAVALASPDVLNGQIAAVHPMCSSSTTIKRVCRSTLMAEMYAMSTGVEHGLRLRAVICVAKGVLDKERSGESASAHVGHAWVADCDSVCEHLVSARNKTVGETAH